MNYSVLSALSVAACGCYHPHAAPPACPPAPASFVTHIQHFAKRGESGSAAGFVITARSAGDSTGPLRNAVVEVRLPEPGATTYYMDEDAEGGRYVHRPLAAGRYAVLVRKPGYRMIADTVTLVRGEKDSAVYQTYFLGICLVE